MRAVFYWEAAGLSLHHANPYGGLLAHAMADLGVELTAGYRDQDWDEAWLLENRQHLDVLHLNWPHYHYDIDTLAGNLARCAKFISFLSQARSLGYKLVWTVHNFYPHESTNRDLDHLARLAITSLSTAIIVHCEYAGELVRKHFHRNEGIFVIPHGNFIEAYPNEISKAEARQRVGVPEHNFVYLYFGNIRPYKGLEPLFEAFSKLPDDDASLLFAGKVYTDYGTTVVEQARQADPRIAIHPSHHYPNEDLQIYFNAADVVVLPFLDVLTSGSAITALGFGKPVIVPALGCLPELVNDSMGSLYDPQQANALEQALRTIRQRDLAACSTAAYHRAESLSWDNIARQTLDAYRYCCLTNPF